MRVRDGTAAMALQRKSAQARKRIRADRFRGRFVSGTSPYPHPNPLPGGGGAGSRQRRTLRIAVAATALASLLTACATSPRLSPATTPAEADLVDIRSLVPDIAQDIRYAGSHNFVGEPVDGYEAPRCFLLRPVAYALAAVEHDLRRHHLRLKLFDCYRPTRAVAHFVRWAGDLDDTRTKAEFYPRLDKSQLLGGYIAPVSGHSRGATVDLTLMQCGAAGARCRPLDMGTAFDFFDERAHTDSPQVATAQRANRYRLRAAMARHGFENYALEWWHYTYRPEPTPQLLYDVPIR